MVFDPCTAGGFSLNQRILAPKSPTLNTSLIPAKTKNSPSSNLPSSLAASYSPTIPRSHPSFLPFLFFFSFFFFSFTRMSWIVTGPYPTDLSGGHHHHHHHHHHQAHDGQAARPKPHWEAPDEATGFRTGLKLYNSLTNSKVRDDMLPTLTAALSPLLLWGMRGGGGRIQSTY